MITKIVNNIPIEIREGQWFEEKYWNPLGVSVISKAVKLSLIKNTNLDRWEHAGITMGEILPGDTIQLFWSQRTDSMDPNTVLAFWTYKDLDKYECDLEITRWGDSNQSTIYRAGLWESNKHYLTNLEKARAFTDYCCIVSRDNSSLVMDLVGKIPSGEYKRILRNTFNMGISREHIFKIALWLFTNNFVSYKFRGPTHITIKPEHSRYSKLTDIGEILP